MPSSRSLSQSPSLSTGCVVPENVGLSANEASAIPIVGDDKVRFDQRMAKFTNSSSGQIARRCRATPASLTNHVYCVIAHGSQKQMIDIHAAAIISTGTVMADEQTLGYWSILQRPRVPMSAHSGSVTEIKLTIARSNRSSSPEPAGFCLVNEIPKSSLHMFRTPLIGEMAYSRAKVEFMKCKKRWASVENILAVKALRWSAIVRWHRWNLQFLGVAGPGLFTQLAASFILPQEGVI